LKIFEKGFNENIHIKYKISKKFHPPIEEAKAERGKVNCTSILNGIEPHLI